MITNKTNAVVQLLNDLIEEAVKDGADSGGAYHMNQQNLMIAAYNLLYSLNLTDYEVISTEDYTHWSTIKIVPKYNSFSVEDNK